ncbi:MAG: hypothetical protein JXB07_18775, partial [Anaerolineae bacterium]|nr:hypothetical protein [Anaerolineae bacterium]
MTDITFVTSEAIQLREYETVIERGLSTFMDVGEALLAIRDKRLYRNTHSTFEEYCQERWGMSRSYAYRTIEAAQVAKRLLPMGNIPMSERQARPLTGLEPDEQIEAWQRVIGTTPAGDITARHVQEAVDRLTEEKNGDNGHGIADELLEDINEETGEILSPSNGNGRHLPQTNRAGDMEEPQGFDDCQTPPYALDPLLPYLSHEWTIWEPARGDGQLVETLLDAG